MKSIVKILCCVSLMSLTSYATSLEPIQGPIPFQIYDTNKDGFISKDEFNLVKATRMSANAEEGKPMKNASNSPNFTFFDTNKDGKISPEELEKGQTKLMQKKGVKQ